MRARLAKGMQPNGREVAALLVESDDGLLVCSLMMPADKALELARELETLARSMGAGIVVVSAMPEVP